MKKIVIALLLVSGIFLLGLSEILAGARQSRKVSSGNRSNANISSSRNYNVNRNSNVNVNKNTNVNVNRNVNVNNNTYVNRNYSNRGAVYHGEETSVAVSNRGVAVKGEEGAAAVGRRGAVVAGDEGVAAAGRYGGAVIAGEEGAVAVGRYGAVGYHEEGWNGVWSHEYYEDYEGWRAVAAVGTAIAVGTMLARPPSSSVVIYAGGTSYNYYDGMYYTRVYQSGSVAYQVVPAPAGAVITTLPGGCNITSVGGISYNNCGGTYYQRVGNGYQVVIIN